MSVYRVRGKGRLSGRKIQTAAGWDELHRIVEDEVRPTMKRGWTMNWSMLDVAPVHTLRVYNSRGTLMDYRHCRDITPRRREGGQP